MSCLFRRSFQCYIIISLIFALFITLNCLSLESSKMLTSASFSSKTWVSSFFSMLLIFFSSLFSSTRLSMWLSLDLTLCRIFLFVSCACFILILSTLVSSLCALMMTGRSASVLVNLLSSLSCLASSRFKFLFSSVRSYQIIMFWKNFSIFSFKLQCSASNFGIFLLLPNIQLPGFQFLTPLWSWRAPSGSSSWRSWSWPGGGRPSSLRWPRSCWSWGSRTWGRHFKPSLRFHGREILWELGKAKIEDELARNAKKIKITLILIIWIGCGMPQSYKTTRNYRTNNKKFIENIAKISS